MRVTRSSLRAQESHLRRAAVQGILMSSQFITYVLLCYSFQKAFADFRACFGLGSLGGLDVSVQRPGSLKVLSHVEYSADTSLYRPMSLA